MLQLHTSESSEAGCNAEGKLQIGQQDLLSIFITSTAEMPGMVFSSLLVDFLGRKRYALSVHIPWVHFSVSCRCMLAHTTRTPSRYMARLISWNACKTK